MKLPARTCFLTEKLPRKYVPVAIYFYLRSTRTPLMARGEVAASLAARVFRIRLPCRERGGAREREREV